MKFCDWSRKEWWFHQWHSVFEMVEFDLRRGLIDSAYATLEQAEFQLSVMTSPSFSKASVKQSKA
ncbi:ORF B64 [Sulfolobus virus Kamchatka 1]|uniref:ORF B64 n=1 Tax=Sulfolobus virus Kamchatka 1 TaxID=248496 RepID=Q6TDM2_9VIRU|nr:ORF B64 [Sulfolobus virus Kamchatka 1]AAQ94377.1 ORF B64 [Sulfolobus virus Kamchatka 1]